MQLDIRGIMFDIDGVLTYQGVVYPGAIEMLDALRRKGFLIRFVTNSTLKSRASCAQKLQAAGFQAAVEEVVTASYATAMYLREIQPKSCWVMLEREGLDEFKDFPQDMENPEYIVIGDNRSRFDFDHLNKVLRLLLKGAKLIGMIPEFFDSSFVEAEINVGAWVKMLELASGVEATYIGKPNTYIFELALKTMQLPKAQVCMVGDQIGTDIQGAQNAGIKSLLLRQGEFEYEKHLEQTVKPDWVCDDIRELVEVLERQE